jgi:hypothetical protein
VPGGPGWEKAADEGNYLPMTIVQASIISEDGDGAEFGDLRLESNI